MPIDSTPSQVATNALQAIPFGSIIGGPLNACIQAQSQAAQTTWQFIQEVGLSTDSQTGEKKAVNVTFQFQQGGKMANLTVPLLTIVPIPYIAINTIDINFKANISASSSSTQENTDSTSMGGEVGGSVSGGFGPFSARVDFKANYSSKKDSKATQDSKYSVEYTMDVAVKAGQDSMPAGLAKVLELLGNSMNVADPKGVLTLNVPQIELGNAPDVAKLIVTFKDGTGLLQSGKTITVSLTPPTTLGTTITVTQPGVTTPATLPQGAPAGSTAVTTNTDGVAEIQFQLAAALGSNVQTPVSVPVTLTVDGLQKQATLVIKQ